MDCSPGAIHALPIENPTTLTDMLPASASCIYSQWVDYTISAPSRTALSSIGLYAGKIASLNIQLIYKRYTGIWAFGQSIRPVG